MKFAWLLLPLILVGCVAISSNTSNHQFTEDKKVVIVSTHYRQHEAVFVHEFIEVLERHGFEIVHLTATSNYRFELDIYGSHLEAALLEGRDKVLTVETVPRFEHPLPKSSAQKSLVSKAVTQFEMALGEMMGE